MARRAHRIEGRHAGRSQDSNGARRIQATNTTVKTSQEPEPRTPVVCLRRPPVEMRAMVSRIGSGSPSIRTRFAWRSVRSTTAGRPRTRTDKLGAAEPALTGDPDGLALLHQH
jgi:hypothetical protein